MDVHEYQAKELLASFGVPVPKGAVAFSPDQAVYAATELGGWNWAVKAQIHAGARGKAGGIKIVQDLSRGARRGGEPARQAAGHHPDRPRRQAGAAGLYRGGRAVRPRALSRLRARPQSRAHPRHRLAARRHGDRGDRQDRARGHPPGGGRAGGGPAGLPGARARLPAWPQHQAGAERGLARS